ncbi:MAG: glycosyltransferase family 4 protein, partial [Stellaceae bacterium]
LFRDGNTARRLARMVDLVVVSSPYLADAWRRWTAHVEVLPMAVDTDRIMPAPLPARPVIGWLGSPGNLPYLEGVAPALAEVAARFPGTTIAVCSKQQPHLPGLPLHYVPWSPAAERPFLDSLSVGIVPLADTPWERGKFSYKMLLYMAAGRPVVGSPVGSNADMLHNHNVGIAASDHEQWVAALSTLLTDHAAAQQLAAEGRLVAVRDYSITAIAPRLAQILRRLAS